MAQLAGMINNLRDGIKTSDIFGKKKISALQTDLDAIGSELDRVLELSVKPDFRFYGREIGVQPLMLPIRVQDICNPPECNKNFHQDKFCLRKEKLTRQLHVSSEVFFFLHLEYSETSIGSSR